MFNSQCSILIRTAGGRTSPSGSDRSRRSYLAWGERRAIRHPLLDGCALLLDVSRYRAHAPRRLAFRAIALTPPRYLMFRAIALTLRADLHSRPLIFG